MKKNTKRSVPTAKKCQRCNGFAVIAQQKLDRYVQIVQDLYNIPKNGEYGLETEDRVIFLRCTNEFKKR